jgi:hypothetical protein
LPPPSAALRGESGVYPCPFGFALSVALNRAERLVPLAADHAAVLAPVADALALVRDSGGFEAMGVRLPTAELRLVFERVPDLPRASRRIQALAADLLSIGMDALPERDPALGFQAALELRRPTAHSLSLHLYVEGTSSAHERLLARLAGCLEPALSCLIEAKARRETHFILRRRVFVRCRVDLALLLTELPPRRPAQDPSRDREAIRQALRWLDAARTEPVLASAQNELVLTHVARVASALGNDAHRTTAEGHCHAARFGAVAPLAAFALLDGRHLAGALELPLGLTRRRRCDPASDLANGLLHGDSIEGIGLLSSCIGLAAHLATVKAAISLALAGAVPARSSSLPPPPVDSNDAARHMPLPVASTPPPPRRSREHSGVRPAVHARRSLPPPSSNPRYRGRG